MKIPAAGGKPQQLTKIDEQKGERFHWGPQVLPDGAAVLFTIGFGGGVDQRVAVLDLKTGQQRVLVEGGTTGRYVPTGHLVYWRSASLFAVPFDASRRQVTGQAVPVLEGVAGSPNFGYGDYSFSNTGTLVYVSGPTQATSRTLVWVDRQGQTQPLAAPPRRYWFPRLSPDGGQVAVGIGPSFVLADIWVYALGRETLTRLTFQPGGIGPVWTPDGKRITFASYVAGKTALVWTPADGSGGPEQLASRKTSTAPFVSWSPDGKLLAYPELGEGRREDIWVLPLEGDRKARLFLTTPFQKLNPEFSPDGRWIAYDSDESGQRQVYVQPAPRAAGEGKWQISTDGGAYPRWARSGREMFYRNGVKVMAVAVESGPPFRAGTPKMLFEGRYDTQAGYDVAADGKRFLMLQPEQKDAGPPPLHVVVDWFEELKRRAPVGK